MSSNGMEPIDTGQISTPGTSHEAPPGTILPEDAYAEQDIPPAVTAGYLGRIALAPESSGPTPDHGRPDDDTEQTATASSLPTDEPAPIGPDGDPRTDNELADAVGNGDMAAFGELWGVRYKPLMERYCQGKLGWQDSAMGSSEDTVQEIGIALFASLRSRRFTSYHESSFGSWVFGVAAHKVTDRFRSQFRDHSLPYADMPERVVTTAGPEDAALAADASRQLRQLLGQLTTRQREILVLRVAVGLTVEETAQTIESTPGGVRVTQHRALDRLRRIIRNAPDLYQFGRSGTPGSEHPAP